MSYRRTWKREEAAFVLIRPALEETDGNPTKAAELLGVNRMRI